MAGSVGRLTLPGTENGWHWGFVDHSWHWEARPLPEAKVSILQNKNVVGEKGTTRGTLSGHRGLSVESINNSGGRAALHYLTEGTWVGVGVSTGPFWVVGVDLMVVPGAIARGGSEAMGTGLMRSDTIGLDRLTTVVDSHPQDSPPKSM